MHDLSATIDAFCTAEVHHSLSSGSSPKPSISISPPGADERWQLFHMVHDMGKNERAASVADGSVAASRAQGHAKASRKRPLANTEDSDEEGAAGAEPAASGTAGSSRRMHVPSRPSGAVTSVRPPGKAVPPEVRCQRAQTLAAQSSHMHEADFTLQKVWSQTGIRYCACPGRNHVSRVCCGRICHGAAH